MKSKKINLSDLEVKSFVTAFDDNSQKTVAGGGLDRLTAWPDGPCSIIESAYTCFSCDHHCPHK